MGSREAEPPLTETSSHQAKFVHMPGPQLPSRVGEVEETVWGADTLSLSYTPVTSAMPSGFKSPLRQTLAGKLVRLVVGVTIYNEEGGELHETLTGIARNLPELGKHGISPDEMVVVIVVDGKEKMSDTMSMYLQKIGLYEEEMVVDEIEPPKPAVLEVMRGLGSQVEGELFSEMKAVARNVHLHLFEKSVPMPKNEALRRYFPPIPMILALKSNNGGKLSSHLWLMEGICRQLHPQFLALFDVGTVPRKTALGRLVGLMSRDPKIGGCCGQIVPRDVQWLSPLEGAQTFEYLSQHQLLKSFEAFVGYVSVLPGAFSAFRWEAIRGVPLERYFLLESAPVGQVDPLTANMFLAEDRILCFETIAQPDHDWVLGFDPDAIAETDIPKTNREWLLQRRRWANGTFGALIWALASSSRLLGAQHSCGRKSLFCTQILVNISLLIIGWFQIAAYFLSYLTILNATVTILIADPGIQSVFLLVFACVYVYLFLVQVVLALAGSIHRLQWTYEILSAVWGLLMSFLVALAVALVIQGLSTSTFAPDAFEVISILAATLIFIIGALIHGEPLKTMIWIPHFLFMLPSLVNLISTYSMAHLNSTSWGTKGAHSNQLIVHNRSQEADLALEDARRLEIIINKLVERTKRLVSQATPHVSTLARKGKLHRALHKTIGVIDEDGAPVGKDEEDEDIGEDSIRRPRWTKKHSTAPSTTGSSKSDGLWTRDGENGEEEEVVGFLPDSEGGETEKGTSNGESRLKVEKIRAEDVKTVSQDEDVTSRVEGDDGDGKEDDGEDDAESVDSSRSDLSSGEAFVAEFLVDLDRVVNDATGVTDASVSAVPDPAAATLTSTRKPGIHQRRHVPMERTPSFFAAAMATAAIRGGGTTTPTPTPLPGQVSLPPKTGAVSTLSTAPAPRRRIVASSLPTTSVFVGAGHGASPFLSQSVITPTDHGAGAGWGKDGSGGGEDVASSYASSSASSAVVQGASIHGREKGHEEGEEEEEEEEERELPTSSFFVADGNETRESAPLKSTHDENDVGDEDGEAEGGGEGGGEAKDGSGAKVSVTVLKPSDAVPIAHAPPPKAAGAGKTVAWVDEVHEMERATRESIDELRNPADAHPHRLHVSVGRSSEELLEEDLHDYSSSDAGETTDDSTSGETRRMLADRTGEDLHEYLKVIERAKFLRAARLRTAESLKHAAAMRVFDPEELAARYDEFRLRVFLSWFLSNVTLVILFVFIDGLDLFATIVAFLIVIVGGLQVVGASCFQLQRGSKACCRQCCTCCFREEELPQFGAKSCICQPPSYFDVDRAWRSNVERIRPIRHDARDVHDYIQHAPLPSNPRSKKRTNLLSSTAGKSFERRRSFVARRTLLDELRGTLEAAENNAMTADDEGYGAKRIRAADTLRRRRRRHQRKARRRVRKIARRNMEEASSK